MIQNFSCKHTEALYLGAGKQKADKPLPNPLKEIARQKLDMLNLAATVDDLKNPPGNHLEALKRDRIGQHSIRINSQYRICFVWTHAGPIAVEIVDYH